MIEVYRDMDGFITFNPSLAVGEAVGVAVIERMDMAASNYSEESVVRTSVGINIDFKSKEYMEEHIIQTKNIIKTKSISLIKKNNLKESSNNKFKFLELE